MSQPLGADVMNEPPPHPLRNNWSLHWGGGEELWLSFNEMEVESSCPAEGNKKHSGRRRWEKSSLHVFGFIIKISAPRGGAMDESLQKAGAGTAAPP